MRKYIFHAYLATLLVICFTFTYAASIDALNNGIDKHWVITCVGFGITLMLLCGAAVYMSTRIRDVDKL